MSQRLAELINGVMSNEGLAGRRRLAAAINRGELTIDRYRKQQSSPADPETVRVLALACGAPIEEAVALARECLNKTKETA